MVAEGLVMSHIRYGIGVYMSGDVRLGAGDPTSDILHNLQVKQNDALRLVQNIKRSDQIRRESLLRENKTKSVNHMAAEAALMELWRANRFHVDTITSNFDKDRSTRRQNVLRSSRDPRSFISKTAKLWNMTSDKFRLFKTNTIQTKAEIRNLVNNQIPIIV